MKILNVLFLILSCKVDIFGCDFLQADVAKTLRIRRFAASETNYKWNGTWTDRLKKDLLLNYDKFSRPAQLGTKIIVFIDFVIRHIEMDEQKSTMTLHSWLRMSWTDEKLKWNSKNYGGLKEIHMADHEIWQPDIHPYNGIIGSVSDHFGNTNCIAQENGTIIWVPPSTFQVFCDIDMSYWPFDKQVCMLKLGSWTYSEAEVDLQVSTFGDSTENILIQNSEWKFLKLDIEKHSVFYSCCPEAYSDVTYNITVQRQSQTYIALLITPATAIIVMALSAFLIPPVSTDKITLGGTTVLIACLFLLYFTQKLPVMAGRTPLIVEFYSRTLYLLSVSLIISVTVINIAKNPKFSPLPWSIKRFLTGCMGKCLLVNNLAFKDVSQSLPNASYKADEGGDNLPVFSDQEKQHEDSGNYEKFQQDWILLAVAIDRVAFFLYCIIFAIFAITYSL